MLLMDWRRIWNPCMLIWVRVEEDELMMMIFGDREKMDENKYWFLFFLACKSLNRKSW
jgi:hypothetical protein